MAGSFSLVEKLAVAGAFCAVVVMAVGTEEDPGLIASNKVPTAAVGVMGERPKPKEASSNFWSVSSDATPAPDVTLAPPPPPPENLPPGFGATPSPDLPK